VTVVPTDSAPAAQAPLAEGQLRLVVDASQSEARYRVTEQLVRLDLPSDAIGRTNDLSGQVVLNSDGAIVAEQSQFTVDLSTLTSDESRRDNFLRRSVLQTNQFPNATFVPREVAGLPSPLPASGPVSFQVTGDLTIRDVTRPATWDFTGQVEGDALTGTATTAFTFEHFDLTQPRVPVVLSVDDNIHLELDLRLVQDS
jgi:polyisoprenoid-binding protein YceI